MTAMVRFTKMHGIGNDYIYINGLQESVADPEALARAIADRHMGVGGDGLILILSPQNGVEADLRMRMFNADGSESAMCGNGIRCVCKYAHDHGLSKAKPMRIQTGTGVLTLEYTIGGDGTVDQVTVDMGEPILEPRQIPVDLPRRHKGTIADVRLDKYIPLNAPVGWMEDCGLDLRMTCISMGNPHVVIYCAHVEAVPLKMIGPFIERQPIFPDRINVHFVQVQSSTEVTMRTWERGSGATLACGSGACAVCVAGVLTDRTDRRLLAHLPGGDLDIRWDERRNHVFMTGPAVEVFTGDWPL